MKAVFRVLMLSIILMSGNSLQAQVTYHDSVQQFRDQYISTHEVVKDKDRFHLSFFPIDEDFRVVARFEPVEHAPWFELPTSGKIRKTFRLYGKVSFRIHDTILQLNLYQSQALLGLEQYRNLLFLPFTDATTGSESYAGGRYIDLETSSIKNNTIIIDFNKAYNPYCAYVSGVYNCPIPPADNHLSFAIRAGEKAFATH